MRPNLRKQLPARYYLRKKHADRRADFLRSLGVEPFVLQIPSGRWQVGPLYRTGKRGRSVPLKTEGSDAV